MMKKKKHPLYIIGFIIYLILMVKFMVLNVPIETLKNGFINLSIKDIWQGLGRTQWLPFKKIVWAYNHQTMKMFVEGIGRYFVCFIPLGFFVPCWYKKHKLLRMIFIGMTGGLLVELFAFLALGYPLRLDAVILAGLGAGMGYGIYKLL